MLKSIQSFNDRTGLVWGVTLYPDYYYCVCGFEITSYDEYVAHVNAEEAQQ